MKTKKCVIKEKLKLLSILDYKHFSEVTQHESKIKPQDQNKLKQSQ